MKGRGAGSRTRNTPPEMLAMAGHRPGMGMLRIVESEKELRRF